MLIMHDMPNPPTYLEKTWKDFDHNIYRGFLWVVK